MNKHKQLRRGISTWIGPVTASITREVWRDYDGHMRSLEEAVDDELRIKLREHLSYGKEDTD